ncbi:MAG: hypothetical protein KBC17_03145 [Candidatus Pacebacteria bacterium]|nr:hypothetical protein [Candidatus Paceibacterota bacterium]
MKKIFLITITFLCTLVAVSSVFAIDLGGKITKEAAVGAGYSGATNKYTFAETVGTVVKAALSLIGIIFLSLMVYAGFLWMNARGDEGEIDKSKEIIKSAIIGLIITTAAYSITAWVLPVILERTAGG